MDEDRSIIRTYIELYLSFNVPNRYTPIGPPVLRATKPIVG